MSKGIVSSHVCLRNDHVERHCLARVRLRKDHVERHCGSIRVPEKLSMSTRVGVRKNEESHQVCLKEGQSPAKFCLRVTYGIRMGIRRYRSKILAAKDTHLLDAIFHTRKGGVYPYFKNIVRFFL